MLWSEYARLYLEHCRLSKRPKTYRNFDLPAVNSFPGNGPIEEITPLHIQSWQNTIAAKYSKSSTAIMWRSLRTAFNHALKLGLIPKNPFAGLAKPEEVPTGRALTEAEVSLILKEAPEPLRTLAVFALNTGCRLDECLSLDWANIRDGIAYIDKKRRKNKKNAQIPLNSACRAVMGSPRASGQVFPFARRTVQEQLNKLWKRHGMGRIRFHDLRHTFVTNYLMRGSESELLEIGTHATREALKGYHHPPQSHLIDRMESLAKKEQAPIVAYWSSSTSSAYAAKRQICARRDLNPQAFWAYAPQAKAITWDGGEF